MDLEGVKTTGVVEEDKEKGIIKVIKPVGVIFALVPCTNPTATPVVKGLFALKTRNAIIMAPHMVARRCTGKAIEFMRKGLEKVGAPVDLIQVLDKPFIERNQQMMAAADLIISTGGTNSVKAAYSSGKPAYGVGAGNSVAIVDETVSAAEAAEKIVASKTFDNATSCSSENSVVIHESQWNDMLEIFKKLGGYLCNEEEKAKLKAAMWPDGEHIEGKIVARPAKTIADAAGIAAPEGVRFIMVLGKEPIAQEKFADEKLSPVMTLWKYSDFDNALDMLRQIHAVRGEGHCCAIHTKDRSRMLKLAEFAPVSRLMVNQPQCLANSGAFTNGMPYTMTLACGTWGGNISSENITWKHMVNYTWMSEPIAERKPDEEKMFKSIWDKYGK
jgi:sulfoacetaldehyde dehydrogenase